MLLWKRKGGVDWGQGVQLPTADSVVTMGLGWWQGWLLHQARVVPCQGPQCFQGVHKNVSIPLNIRKKIVGQEKILICNVIISIVMPMQS